MDRQYQPQFRIVKSAIVRLLSLKTHILSSVSDPLFQSSLRILLFLSVLKYHPKSFKRKRMQLRHHVRRRTP